MHFSKILSARGFALLFAFYFTLGSLIPGTDFRQLGLMVNMFHHYNTHRVLAERSAGDTGFLSFIWEHIISPADHDDLKNHTHAGLPFQVLQQGVTFILAWIPLSVVLAEEGRRQPDFFHPSLELWNLFYDVFHPPIRF